MQKWKTAVRRFLFPPLWLLLLLMPVSAAALALVFAMGWEESPLAYGAYALSFYTLTVLCLFCWKRGPGCYRRVKARLYRNPYAKRYFTDAAFRTHISLYMSLGINLLYIAVHLFSEIRYRTGWFAALAAYYTIMGTMKFLLARYIRRVGVGGDRLGELRRSRACAWILITVNLALSGTVLMMVRYGRGFSYGGMMIYVVALYTFWVTVSAVVALFRYRKYNSPVMSMTKTIGLAAAMVSMLSLETAMFAQFGGDSSPEMQRGMIIATGACIAAAVVAMAAYRIVRATKEIQEAQKKEPRT